MNHQELISKIFVDPSKTEAGHFQFTLNKMVSLILKEVNSNNPLPPIMVDPVSTDGIISKLKEMDLSQTLRFALNQSMNPYSPGYAAHMDPPPTMASVVAECLTAFINNNMLCYEMAPLFTHLEMALTKDFAKRFGLGEASGGLMVTGGTLANIQAVVVARNVKCGSFKVGIQGSEKRPVILISREAHVSLKKATMIAGLGLQGCIEVETDSKWKMNVQDLVRKIHWCHDQKLQPIMVVGTLGTTITGSLDPMEEIAKVAHEHNLWFHVDAALAGSLILSPNYKSLFRGVEQADSIAFNPQKWMYITKVCAMVLFRDMKLLENYYRIEAPYMAARDGVPNLGEFSIQGTRYPDSLKLWLSLKEVGVESYQCLWDHQFKLTEQFVAEIRNRPYLELSYDPELPVICFRAKPKLGSTLDSDAWNNHIQQYLLSKHHISLSLPFFQNQRHLRAVLINPFIQEGTILDMFKGIDEVYEVHRSPTAID